MSKLPRVLIADDDRDLLMGLAIRLRSVDVDVVTACDGYSSLAKAVENRFDAMILDVNMPAGDGFSVQQRLKNLDRARSIPVIYLTGDYSDHLKQMACDLGAVSIHRKPFDFAKLVDDLYRVL